MNKARLGHRCVENKNDFAFASRHIPAQCILVDRFADLHRPTNKFVEESLFGAQGLS
jgi:hypothetical protein